MSNQSSMIEEKISLKQNVRNFIFIERQLRLKCRENKKYLNINGR